MPMQMNATLAGQELCIARIGDNTDGLITHSPFSQTVIRLYGTT